MIRVGEQYTLGRGWLGVEAITDEDFDPVLGMPFFCFKVINDPSIEGIAVLDADTWRVHWTSKPV